ncbi:hypothetical protein J2T34_001812 [Kerstersia gyiorum]|nr:hypothetical protein [Kerstersia gyiorum]MCP1709070.1 hypothetical protein [Kerstersia gyiorum]
MVQRVSEDHHCLKDFRRGEDEYLQDCAWLYWTIQDINPGNPDWSPIGIPHTDIEVLHPDGQWLNMEDIPVLTHHTKQNWKSVDFGMPVERYPVYWAVKQRSNGEQIVLIRQPYRVGRCHIECNDEHAQIILHILRECAFSSRNISRTRWFYAHESGDYIVSEELQPVIRRGLKGYLKKLIARWNTNMLHCDWNVSLPKSGSFCRDSQTDELYKEFNLAGLLLRGERWTYVDSPCALPSLRPI